MSGFYSFGLLDAPGTVGAQNYVSLFNPVGSGVTVYVVDYIANSYVITTDATNGSAALYKTSAASGGVNSSSSINKLNSSSQAPRCVVLTGNPTVTPTTFLLATPPPLGAGSFNGNATEFITASGLSGAQVLQSGEGLVITQASANVNQRWNFTIGWTEI